MIAVVAATWIAVSSDLGVYPKAGPIAADRAAAAAQGASGDCVRFQSPARLAAGTPFRTALLRGLEFRLSDGWDISIGPVSEPTMDYLWVVSPPLQTAPHRMIGAGYGLTARQSARIQRRLRFVLTRADYDAARAAIDLRSAEDTLKRLDQLGRGRLSFVITDFQVRDLPRVDRGQGDAFDWITFEGEACVPKGGQGAFRMDLANLQMEPTRAGS